MLRSEVNSYSPWGVNNADAHDYWWNIKAFHCGVAVLFCPLHTFIADNYHVFRKWNDLSVCLLGLPTYSSVVQLADFPSWLWPFNLKFNTVVGNIVLAVTERNNSCNNCLHEQEAALRLSTNLTGFCTYPNPTWFPFAPVGIYTLGQKRGMASWFSCFAQWKIGKVCKKNKNKIKTARENSKDA